MSLTVATWNVNSVRARLDRLVAFLERARPDVLCLQELKLEDAAFPHDAVRGAGYVAVTHGQKTYNGVAILAREEPRDVERGFGDEASPEGAADGQARFLTARVHGVRVSSAYFPNGGEVDSPKYPYKLAWMRRLRGWLDARVRPDEPYALCGDFNVAPDDRDCARPEAWRDGVLANDEVRAALEQIRAFGLVDCVRKHLPDGGVYTWWDYRQLAFPKNDGLRIDHVFATAPLAARSTGARVDRDERKGKQASDHAPVLVTFDL
jgi:exodeoxyribonuclease-3